MAVHAMLGGDLAEDDIARIVRHGDDHVRDGRHGFEAGDHLFHRILAVDPRKREIPRPAPAAMMSLDQTDGFHACSLRPRTRNSRPMPCAVHPAVRARIRTGSWTNR